MTDPAPRHESSEATVPPRPSRRSGSGTTDGLSPGRLAMVAVLAVFVLLGLSKPTLLLAGVMAHADASTLRQAAYGAITLVALIAARPIGRWKRILCVPWPFVAALCWFAFSILWSPVPAASVSRLGVTAIVLWLAFQCPDRLGATRATVTIRIVLGAWLLLNYVAVVAVPDIGIHDFGESWSRGQWRGWMAHKNFLGMAAAVTLLFALFPGGDRRTWLPRLALALGALPMLLFSQSRAAMIGALVGTLVGGAITRLGPGLTGPAARKARIVVLASSGAILVLLLVVTFDPALLTGLLDDPDGLSGRTQIWQALIASFRDHPLFGTGYGAFWSAGVATAPDTATTGWQAISTGHNGYFDLAVQTGLIGLLVALGAVFLWAGLRIVLLAAAHPAVAGLAAALVAFALANNFAESSLFDGDWIPQLFLLLGLGLLQAAARRGQRGPSAEPAVLATASRGSRTVQRRRRRSTGSGQ